MTQLSEFEIISHIQLMMPELFWVKEILPLQHNYLIKFVTSKKRLNFYQIKQVCDFMNGKDLSKSKNEDFFYFKFKLNNNQIIIRTFFDIKKHNIKTATLNNGAVIKFIEL